MAYTDQNSHPGRFGRYYFPGPQDLLPPLLAWFRSRRKRKEVLALLHQEDWLLKDMGLSRGDVIEALSHRGNESAHLRATAARNRRNRRTRVGL